MHIPASILFHPVLLMLLMYACSPHTWASEQGAIWQTLKDGGHVVLIRHAITEAGIGDPPEFKLGDCRTQRNLSEQGRTDAKRIGEAFRSRGIPIADVLSSRWCRCLDTAHLAFGKARPSAMLDSMFNDGNTPREAKLDEFRAAVAKPPTRGNLILVTHQVNIQEFAGVSPASGEMVVLKTESGRLKLVGRMTVPKM
jgi:phosphohistidine phosphatase SixA